MESTGDAPLHPPVVLVLAGSDPLSGAGVVADALTVAELGVHPITATTAFVDQDSRNTRTWIATNDDAFVAQLEAALADGRPDAIKCGMLGSRRRVEQIGDRLAAGSPRPPVVLDPVLRAGLDDESLADSGLSAALRALARRLSSERLFVLTPNRDELATLTEQSPATEPQALADQAESLHRDTGAAVLAKGGHLTVGRGHDFLVHNGVVNRLAPLAWPIKDDVHGTGCCLSSAIAALLARGMDLPDAVDSAREVLVSKVGSAIRVGGGRRQIGPLRRDVKTRS